MSGFKEVEAGCEDLPRGPALGQSVGVRGTVVEVDRGDHAGDRTARGGAGARAGIWPTYAVQREEYDPCSLVLRPSGSGRADTCRAACADAREDEQDKCGAADSDHEMVS